MDDAFEIEILEQSESDGQALQLPQNVLTLGDIEAGDVEVYIRQEVYQALEALAASDTSRELGSILLGQYTREGDKTRLVISQYIEAKYTDASATTLKFTHETWDYVHAQRAKHFPEMKIVGWQHTHPSYGIFLSNYDMFIQENFFNLPFQIAYVIDPVQNLRGFFQWKDGRVQKLRGYYIYSEGKKPIKIPQVPVKKEAPPGRSPVAAIVIAVLSLLCLTLAGLLLVQRRQPDAQPQLQVTQPAEDDALQQQLAAQQAELQRQEQLLRQQEEIIAGLRQLLEEKTPDGKTTAQELLEMLKADEASGENRQQLIRALEDLLAAGSEGEGVTFGCYTVAAGDNLTRICKAHGLNYRQYRALILALNGIDDPSRLEVGQKLLLPLPKAEN